MCVIPIFGEPVSGFHLVNGRASYGIGLQFFFLGYPLHFDWSKLTDLKVVQPRHSSSTSGSGLIFKIVIAKRTETHTMEAYATAHARLLSV